jgi:hypothetical protein
METHVTLEHPPGGRRTVVFHSLRFIENIGKWALQRTHWKIDFEDQGD